MWEGIEMSENNFLFFYWGDLIQCPKSRQSFTKETKLENFEKHIFFQNCNFVLIKIGQNKDFQTLKWTKIRVSKISINFQFRNRY